MEEAIRASWRRWTIGLLKLIELEPTPLLCTHQCSSDEHIICFPYAFETFQYVQMICWGNSALYKLSEYLINVQSKYNDFPAAMLQNWFVFDTHNTAYPSSWWNFSNSLACKSFYCVYGGIFLFIIPNQPSAVCQILKICKMLCIYRVIISISRIKLPHLFYFICKEMRSAMVNNLSTGCAKIGTVKRGSLCAME